MDTDRYYETENKANYSFRVYEKCGNKGNGGGAAEEVENKSTVMVVAGMYWERLRDEGYISQRDLPMAS